MLNIIKMELYRMFKTRSFYVTIAVCIAMTIAIPCIMSEFVNGLQSSEDDVIKITMASIEDFIMSPITFTSDFISMLCIFCVIFATCFVDNFYKNGFCKNVMSCAINRYYFQVSKTVCILIYTAVIMFFVTAVSLTVSSIVIDNFEFIYIKEFIKYLIGEYGLLCCMGLFSAFLTELTRSKIASITYIVLISTDIVTSIISLLNQKLSDFTSNNIVIENYFPSLYQLKFNMNVPDVSQNNSILIHAVILSLVFFAIYNTAGAVLISKRDIK